MCPGYFGGDFLTSFSSLWEISLLLTYKALNDQAPLYIRDMLHFCFPARNLRSSSKGLLKVTTYNFKSYGDRLVVSFTTLKTNRAN